MMLILHHPDTVAAVTAYLLQHPKLLAAEAEAGKQSIIPPQLQSKGVPGASRTPTSIKRTTNKPSFFDPRFRVEFYDGTKLRRTFSSRRGGRVHLVFAEIRNEAICFRHPKTKKPVECSNFNAAEIAATDRPNSTGGHAWKRWQYQATDGRWYPIERLRAEQGL